TRTITIAIRTSRRFRSRNDAGEGRGEKGEKATALARPSPFSFLPSPLSQLLVQRIPELLAELIGEFRIREALILRARVFDFQRTHQRGHAPAGRQVHVLHEAVDQTGAIRIAATSRIGDAAFVRGWDVERFLVRVDQRTLRSARDNIGLDAL